MSRVELESFLKSFILFFSSLGILIASLFYINYTKEIQTLDERIFSQMRVCSFDLKCEQFKIDFLEKSHKELYTLYKNEEGLSSYYPIPNSQKYILLLHLNADKYNQQLKKLQNKAIWDFSAILIIVIVLSVLFSVYALYPLRNALLLTQEFIKDILHDFNTPLASLRLNSSMLKREIGENEKINRMEQSIENILNLQQHLRSYLHNHTMQKEEFDLQTLLEQHIYLLEKNYPKIHFTTEIQSTKLLTNKKAFSRIIDNILTNAAKYNKTQGSVSAVYDARNKNLRIIDTGKGIKAPQRIFERFYKEQERGIGIGLHIVKKLCDEIGVKIDVQSEISKGTTFTLNLSRLTLD
ncbi:HAMP domain-containing histidine kinase [bacterium]|nr:HAMP domain-containing histidine kinase [bacterium]MBU1995030.1 HAMP domain-containing histidine kinase [bacterium]